MILDKIYNLKKIYYAGDFDPEGIDIAYKIKEIYKDKVEFLFYTEDIYMDIKSEETINDRRLKIIKNMQCDQLDSLINAILKNKKAAYQEMIISKYIEYINDNIEGDLSMEMLASRFNITRFSISRHFKNKTGDSLHSYIIKRRLVTAKELIGEGYSMKVASQKSGFKDYSTFVRAFKKEYDMSPREYLKNKI